MTAANALRRGDKPIFASTRFGNVLGSRGSVIPVFKRQIRAGGPVTLTDPEMTRFIMTLDEAVRLVMDSVFLARGGDVFVTKMPILRITDLAEVMVEELGNGNGAVPVKTVGTKAGEKLYEELMNEEETRRTVELDRYFVIIPAFRSLYADVEYVYPGQLSENGGVRAYNSANSEPLGREELREYLTAHRLLNGAA